MNRYYWLSIKFKFLRWVSKVTNRPIITATQKDKYGSNTK